MKYVSVNTVFQLMPKSILDEFTMHELQEYAVQAIDFIAVPMVYERKGCLVEFANHKAVLPTDLRFIDTVAWLSGQPSNGEVDQIVTTISTDKEYVDGNLVTTTTSTTTKPTNIDYNLDHIMRIQRQGVLNNYLIWEDTSFYNKYFTILKYNTAGLRNSRMTKNCPNFNACCPHQFTVETDNTLKLSIESGILYIAYLALATDDCGELLIPNIVQVKNAIAKYIMYLISQEKMWSNDANSRYMYEKYQQEASTAIASAKGQLFLQAVDMEEIDRIVHYTIQPSRSTIVFDNQVYYD